VLVAAIAALLILALRRDGARVLSAAVLVLLIAGGCGFRLFIERAYLFGDVALVLFLAVLFTVEWSSRRSVAALVAIQIVWTRLHGSAMLGPLLALAFVLAAALERARAKQRPALERSALLLALLLAALCTGRLGVQALEGYLSLDGVLWEALAGQAAEI